MQELTVYEIAKMAGVSVATVSKVLNNRSGIHEETAAKVRKVLDETGFEPRWCASAGTKTVAFVTLPYVGCLGDNYVGRIFSSCFEALRREGYATLCLSQEQVEQLCSNGSDLGMSLSVSGVIMIGQPSSFDLCKKLYSSRKRLPVVIIGRFCEGQEEKIGNLVKDEFTAGYQAAQLLLRQNHRNFMIVSPNLNNLDHKNRVDGIIAAIESEKTAQYRLEFYSGSLWSNGEKLALKLSGNVERPDCLIFTNGVNCAGFVSSCNILRMPIPETFSVIGFEDGEELTYLSPPITAMRNPALEIGEKAVELLLAQVKKKKEIISPPLKYQLMLRHSVRMTFV